MDDHSECSFKSYILIVMPRAAFYATLKHMRKNIFMIYLCMKYV